MTTILNDDIFLSEIYIYPIKSLGGIKLNSVEFETRGLKNDRRYMLIDENNKFVTQREYPKMSLIKVDIDKDFLTCKFNDDILKVPVYPDNEFIVTVNVWDSYCKAILYNKEINDWFSNILNKNVRLVYMPESTNREVNKKYKINENDIVSFADGYPFLLASQSSLDDLNSKLDNEISINRFRPNFVIKGAIPFIEDESKEIIIGDYKFFIVKPCERCVITTINQETGERFGKEPLKTLSTYRKVNNKIIFGQNLISELKEGNVRVGDRVSII